MPNEATHNAWSAEPTLGGAMRDERIGPSSPFLLGQSIHSGDGSASYPSKGSHTSNPGGVVNQDSATTALALRTAPVLYRSNA